MTKENLVLFKLNDNLLAFRILDIKEIIRNAELKSLPSQPEFISGILNLRGEAIPIIDLKKRFFLGNESNELYSRIFLVELDNGKKAGFRVDHVIGLKELNVITELEEYLEKFYIKSHFINSIAFYDEDMVVIINKEEIFNEIETELLETMNTEIG